MNPVNGTLYLNRGPFRLAFRQSGEGEAVVLLHGFGLDRRSMAGLAAALAERYRVITLDWRGHGDSRCPSRDELFSYALLRDDLRAVLDVLKIDRAHLIGHSMGGQIALMLAISDPDRVRSLTTLGSGPCRAVTTDRERQTWRETADYFAAATGTKLLRALCTLSRVSESAEQRPPLADLYSRARGPELASMIRGAFLTVETNDEACARLNLPALVAVGADDLDYRAYAQKLGRLIPNSRWALIDGAGHLPHLEQPSAVTSLVHEFLAAQVTAA